MFLLQFNNITPSSLPSVLGVSLDRCPQGSSPVRTSVQVVARKTVMSEEKKKKKTNSTRSKTNLTYQVLKPSPNVDFLYVKFTRDFLHYGLNSRLLPLLVVSFPYVKLVSDVTLPLHLSLL